MLVGFNSLWHFYRVENLILFMSSKHVNTVGGNVSWDEDKGNAISNELFVQTVKEHYPNYLRRAYVYVKCQSTAQDVVQEGVLSAHKNIASVNKKNSLGAWLSKIIVRTAINVLYKQKRFPSIDHNLDDLVSYDKNDFLIAPVWAEVSEPEEEVLKNEGLEQVKAALNCLTDIYRIPLLLKDFEGFSVREISEILEISESNVKVRVHRARIKLRAELNDYFFPSSQYES